ncbi:hypothetical protein C8R44DRAFT_990640 [Mycena epipterygia]|nr:hypothetical protein C8R44DRAFT_990640 [Mycena epipterygia]
MRRLTSEILVQIFALCSDPVFEDEDSVRGGIPSFWGPPYCLGTYFRGGGLFRGHATVEDFRSPWVIPRHNHETPSRTTPYIWVLLHLAGPGPHFSRFFNVAYVLRYQISPGAFSRRLDREVGDHFEASDCIQALSELLPSLGLPHLHELTFQSAEYPYAVIHWSETGFLPLGARSSFHTHLQSLRLRHVIITEAALLETLSTLPLLQQLEIADHELRCRARGSGLPPFVSELQWLPDHQRELDPGVSVRLRKLRINNALLVVFLEAEL